MSVGTPNNPVERPGAGTAAPRPDWIDGTLAPLLRHKVKWPVAASERGQAQQHRRLQRLVAGFIVLLIGTFNALILGFGVPLPLPVHLIVTVAVPVGVLGLLYVILYFVQVRGRRDEDGHPWKFYADARGMSLEMADGGRVGGRWQDWHYEGYVYGTFRNNRFLKGIDLSLDGRRYGIDLLRIPRSAQLARGIVQGLAAARRQ